MLPRRTSVTPQESAYLTIEVFYHPSLNFCLLYVLCAIFHEVPVPVTQHSFGVLDVEKRNVARPPSKWIKTSNDKLSSGAWFFLKTLKMFLIFSEHQNLTKLSLPVEQNQSTRRTDTWYDIRWPGAGRGDRDGRILQNLLWVVKPIEKWSFFCRKFYYFDSCFYPKTFSFWKIS